MLTQVKDKVKRFFGVRYANTAEINALIKRASKTQKGVAGDIGVHHVNFNKIINNKDGLTLSPQKSHALAELLGVSVDVIQDLFGI